MIKYDISKIIEKANKEKLRMLDQEDIGSLYVNGYLEAIKDIEGSFFKTKQTWDGFINKFTIDDIYVDECSLKQLKDLTIK